MRVKASILGSYEFWAYLLPILYSESPASDIAFRCLEHVTDPQRLEVPDHRHRWALINRG